MTDNKKDIEESENTELPEVKDELSKVSVSPKQSLALLIGIGIIGVFVVFNVFFSSQDDTNKKKKVALPKNIVKPSEELQNKDKTIVKLPDLPSINTPPPPPPSPPLPVNQEPKETIAQIVPLPIQSNSSTNLAESSDKKKQRMDSKNKAAIFSISGSGGSGKKNSAVVDVIATGYTTDYLIASGKIMDATLETAINTDDGMESAVKAIISRDVYSESGKTILIPKGSKIYGTYSANMSNPRIGIIWNKLYLNSGTVIRINAKLVDNLGRSGQEGRFDPKNKEKFVNAAISSAFNIAAAKGIDTLITPSDNSAGKAAAINTATQIRNQAFNLASQNPNPTIQTAISTLNQICSFVQNSISDKSSSAYTGMVTQCQAIQLANNTDPKTIISQAVAAANSAADSLMNNTQENQTKTQQAATDAYKNITSTVSGMLQKNVTPSVALPQGTPIRIEFMNEHIFPRKLIK